MTTYKAIDHSKVDQESMSYDVGNAIGWMMAGVVMLFARPIVWAVFGDHEVSRRVLESAPVETLKKLHR
jgi:hypothetical protein